MGPEIIIRKMYPTDLEEAMQLKDAEGWNQTREDWEFLLSSNPDQCLVVVLEGKVKATVTAITYDNQLAWIGMMLVDKSIRGQGIGKLLMRSIIKELGFCTAVKLDATPAGLPVYLKLGFTPEATIYRMTGRNDKCEKFKQPHPNIRGIKSEDLPKILEYDSRIFGVSREELFRDLLKRSPQSCFLFDNDNFLHGFTMGRPGTRYFQLGPLSADSPQVAIQLLELSLSQPKDSQVVVDVFQDKVELVSWLQGQGFTIQRELTRMSYGKPSLSENRHKQFLISGPELG
jgi:GNAT superfamily N-acetyltransferase